MSVRAHRKSCGEFLDSQIAELDGCWAGVRCTDRCKRAGYIPMKLTAASGRGRLRLRDFIARLRCEYCKTPPSSTWLVDKRIESGEHGGQIAMWRVDLSPELKQCRGIANMSRRSSFPQRSEGIRGVRIAHSYVTRVRVAIWARDVTTAARFTAFALAEPSGDKNLAATARHEPLVAEARSAGIDLAIGHGQSEMGPAIGRRNFLFTGSADAAQWLADAYTLVQSCRGLGISTRDYLIDVLDKLEHG